jgi:uncharacterized protein YdeI (BOF family)
MLFRAVLFFLFACTTTFVLEGVAPKKATSSVLTIPIQALVSTTPPKEPIWIRAQIAYKTDDDTYLIQDKTGQITLFLPTDDLIALELTSGMEVLIYGKLDISPVTPKKNEFYAEKILLPND